jgi:hypothetical protein
MDYLEMYLASEASDKNAVHFGTKPRHVYPLVLVAETPSTSNNYIVAGLSLLGIISIGTSIALGGFGTPHTTENRKL